MKKLILASVIALGSFTTFAAVPVISNNDFVETVYVDQDDYTPIDATELPDAITNALETDFPGVQVSKAFKNGGLITRMKPASTSKSASRARISLIQMSSASPSNLVL